MKKKELIELLEEGCAIYNFQKSKAGTQAVSRDIMVYDKDGEYVSHISSRNLSNVFSLVELTQVIQDGVEQPQGTYPCDKGSEVAWEYRAKYELKK